MWFEDEARFGQQGTLTRVWARTGSRPRAVKQTRYDWVYLLGAACPQTGQSVGLLAPDLNTQTVNVFLAQLARELPPDVHGVLLWDQAGYHTSGDLVVPPQPSLLYLPPKSPELNPMENLWHYLRSHHWANRAYDNYDHLRQAGCQAWQAVCLDPPLLRSVCAAPWLEEARQ